MAESSVSGVEAFESWCEGLAARKARNAVPGEPAAPLVNAILVSSKDLIDAFQRVHPEYADSRSDLETFAEDFEPGLEVDKVRWKALTNA